MDFLPLVLFPQIVKCFPVCFTDFAVKLIIQKGLETFKELLIISLGVGFYFFKNEYIRLCPQRWTDFRPEVFFYVLPELQGTTSGGSYKIATQGTESDIIIWSA